MFSMSKRDRMSGGLAILAGVGLILWAYLGLKEPAGAAPAPRNPGAYRADLDGFHDLIGHALTGLLGLALVGAGVAFGLIGKPDN
jgi:hypothetical protein